MTTEQINCFSTENCNVCSKKIPQYQQEPRRNPRLVELLQMALEKKKDTSKCVVCIEPST